MYEGELVITRVLIIADELRKNSETLNDTEVVDKILCSLDAM